MSYPVSYYATEAFVQAVKDAGVDKVAFVSAGWNAGGYDGRLPDHFPVEPTLKRVGTVPTRCRVALHNRVSLDAASRAVVY